MKRFFCLTFLCLSLCSTLVAEIIETENFSDITNYITDDTLIVLDIDDTLLVPVQTLGTDVWFLDQLRKHKIELGNPELALDKALAEWEAIRHITQVRIVEEGTAEIIQQLQDNNISIIGLTTQGLALSTRTVLQLGSLGIDLTQTAPSDQDYYFMNDDKGVLYRDGILFTSATSKGNALYKLFDILDYFPSRVVFINDKKTHLMDVDSKMFAEGIDFIGLRYSYSDERVANYDPLIADVQWRYSTFDRIVSDEEAIFIYNAELVFGK